jgi:hypothetical protein
MLKRRFTEHPASVGETYTEHMAMAFSFSGRLFVAALKCAVHGIFPFLFERDGSAAIGDLHRRMVTHRTKDRAPVHAPAE